MMRMYQLVAAGMALLAVGVVEAQQDEERHPFYECGFYPEWGELAAAQGAKDVRAGIQLAKQRLAKISELKPEQANYENVFAAFEDAPREMERAEGYLDVLSSTMDNEELRRVQEELLPEMSLFNASMTADEKLWEVIKAAAAAPWVKQLSPEKQRYVQQVVDTFRDSGADLNSEQKQRLAQIQSELSLLAHQFDKNVLDATNSWQWVVSDSAQLAGMTKEWMAQAQESAMKEGHGSPETPKWLITLQEPSALEVIRSCDVEATRKKCWEALAAVGREQPYDNAGIVARVMELRKEQATLLGFRSFADLMLAHRMAGSGQRAMEFVDDMMQKVKPAFDGEVAQLMEFISKCKGDKIEKLNPWDTSYYMRKLAKERFSFDTELLRPYQECDHVLRGMFSIFEKLYSIRIHERDTVFRAADGVVTQRQRAETSMKSAMQTAAKAVPVWRQDVRAFAVLDAKSGAHLGSFYMDLFPRSTKRRGAWVQPLDYGKPATQEHPHGPHLAALVANLSPATEEKPALFSHYDVETLFHEFGHMMHCMLGDTELRAHCGTSVTWDFVELPSQMNENWTWEPESILTYAVHYETGESIPDDYLQKLQKIRFFFPAFDNMNQLCIAKLDMEMHMHYAEKFWGKDIDEATRELLGPWRAPYSREVPSVMRTLTHCISGGYAAGYYSYKWSEVLAADVFTRFSKEGILNPAVGAAYREKILSKGDSKPAGELYRDFMGRDPNPDALLQKQGLMK